MATPTKDKNGTWHLQAYIATTEDGQRIYKRFTGISSTDVRSQAAKYKREVQKQKKIARTTTTLRDAVTAYLDYLESKRTPVSPSTMRSYRQIARNHFQALMDQDLYSITEDQLQREIYAMETKLSAKTIANIKNFIVPAIRHSRRDFRPELELPSVERPDVQVPDTARLSEDLSMITNRRLYVPVVLGAYCGLRRSEIAALDLREDVEYDRTVTLDGEEHRVCILHITRAMVQNADGEWILKSTKSRAGTRNVFCADWVNDLLKECRDDPDFRMYKPFQISNTFAEWAKKHGIRCSFHGLRHYYCSVMDALGVPDQYAMKLMGHATDSILKQYKEIMADKETEVNRTLLAFLEANSPANATEKCNRCGS